MGFFFLEAFLLIVRNWPSGSYSDTSMQGFGYKEVTVHNFSP